MILCHKCSGTFEQVPNLFPCSCISGYPRGFETSLSSEAAQLAQRAALERRLALYRSQGRSEQGSHIQHAIKLLAAR